MQRAFSTYVEHMQNNIRAFGVYVESSELHNLYFVAHTCLHISFLPEQWRCCTKLTIFTSLLDTHTFYPYCQPLAHWWVRNTERKRNWERLPYLSLFFLCYYFQHRLFQGGNRSKKRYDTFPWLFMFFRIPLPPFCNWSKFWFQWKAWPLRLRLPPTYFCCTLLCVAVKKVLMRKK